ncbi:uncharacterized protein [Rhodnius prolixus]|uniref:uncharacterized protein n=1 Tax=Rhodnius prolixus TaxID=13249 RepID=UPI003D18B62A
MMEAVLLMLLLVGQWRFTVAASDVIEVSDELRLLQNDIRTFWDKVLHEEQETKMSPFQRSPNTTIIKNKLHELQNNVTKLTEDLTNSNQNVDAINVRIVEFGTQLENLKRLYDNEIRELRQSLGTFQFSSSQQLLHEYGERHNREQQLVKINLDQDDIEFLEAIKNKYYKFAAVKFIALKNESEATELIRKVYRQLDNVDCLLNFVHNLNNMNKTLLVYRTLSDILGGFINILKLG